MPEITHNRAFPYENDELDILVGTRDENDPRDEDDTTYGFDEKKRAATSLASTALARTATTRPLAAPMMIPSKAAKAWTHSMGRAAMTIFMAARTGTGSLAATTMITSSVRAVLTRCTAIPVMMNFMAVN